MGDMIFVITFLLILLTFIVVAAVWASKVGQKKNPAPKNNATGESSRAEAERDEIIQKVAAYAGHARITQEDVRAYTIHCISEDFAAMPDWSVWDESVHQHPPQFVRMQRAVAQNLSVLAYDPKYKMAKVEGSGGEIYLTSAFRCSCPDFRERHLPCKHMYALAIALEGNVEQVMQDTFDKPLYPLSFALAGHFQGRAKTPENIRSQIIERGGQWMDDINPRKSSAVVVGNAPSQARIDRAKCFDMEILTPEIVLDLFSSCQKQ